MLCLLAWAPQGLSNEVIWDLVADKGVAYTNAKPGVDVVIAEAKAYLNSNPDDTLVLYFPAGTYEFHHPTSRGIDVRSSTSGNLVFRGAGTDATKLVFDQFDQISIYVGDSSNVTFEQMHVTRTGNGGSDPYGFYATQGEVTEVETGRIRFELHEGFPDPVWLFNAGTAADYERTLLAFRGTDLEPELHPKAAKIMVGNRTTGLGDVVDAGGGFYDALLANSNEVPDVVVGDRVAMKSKCGHQTFRMLQTTDCILQDLLITRFSGNPIRMPYGGNNLIVRRVVIDRPEPINGRASFFSGPGGGIQLYANSGGSLVEDCVVIGTADDGIAIFSHDPTNLTQNTIVRRNIVMDNQARGILITHSDGGVIENNTLIRNQDNTIRFQVESSAEGVPTAAAKNWTVANNTLIQPWTASTIRLVSETIGGLHDNIHIVSNLILQASKNCNLVQVDNSGNVMIDDNEILSFSAEEDTQQWGSSDALVQVLSAVSVTGSNNTYAGTLTRPKLDNQDAGAVVSVQWGGGSASFQCLEDSFVDSKSPDRNQGASVLMKTDNQAGRQWMGLVKFSVAGIPADHKVTSARLRVMPCEIYTPLDTPQLYACSDNSWSEMSVTWNNRPAVGEMLASSERKYIAGNLIEFDVSSAVTENGTFSFYLHNAESGGFSQYASRENGVFMAPELVVETEPISAEYSAWIGGFNVGSQSGLFDNPDGDRLDNLSEYGLGGTPDSASDPSSIFPRFGKIDGEETFEYVYRRRRNPAGDGLTYAVELTDHLVSNGWENAGDVETGSGILNADFELVTNQIPMVGKLQQMVRLRIGIE